MMGWWFPGRTLLSVFPLLVIPLTLVAARAGRMVPAMLALGIYSVAVTAGLAQACWRGDHGSGSLDMSFPPFRAAAQAPSYTSWTWRRGR